MSNARVMIAGAGPVGLTMALALKHKGVDVRIVDKAAARTDKSKALVLWSRTLELLDIEGCAQPFVDAGLKGIGAHIMADGKELVRVPLDTARSAYRYALMIPQSDTERLLEEQLASIGVVVERSTQLASFVQDGSGVSSVLRLPDGRDETVRSDWLVASDGAHSTVRHALGATFEGDTLPSDWILADVEIDGPVPSDELVVCLMPQGVLALFPIGGTRHRVIADMGTSEPAPAGTAGPAGAAEVPAPTLQDVQRLLDERGPAGLHARDPIWLSRFRINERKVRDYRYGRVFLTGDAAHVHSPAGGQGMNTGMQDAFNLAWKLAMVCQARASDSLLDSYSPERSAIGDQVLRNAGNLTRMALLRNPILQELRSLAVHTLSRIPALRQAMVDQLTEIDLHYAHSALTSSVQGGARHPASGGRARDVALRPSPSLAAMRLHEALRGGRFVVLCVGCAPVALPPPLLAVANVAVADTDASVDAGYDAGHLYLIRPDAYVATSAQAADAAAIIEALERIRGDIDAAPSAA